MSLLYNLLPLNMDQLLSTTSICFQCYSHNSLESVCVLGHSSLLYVRLCVYMCDIYLHTKKGNCITKCTYTMYKIYGLFIVVIFICAVAQDVHVENTVLIKDFRGLVA